MHATPSSRNSMQSHSHLKVTSWSFHCCCKLLDTKRPIVLQSDESCSRIQGINLRHVWEKTDPTSRLNNPTKSVRQRKERQHNTHHTEWQYWCDPAWPGVCGYWHLIQNDDKHRAWTQVRSKGKSSILRDPFREHRWSNKHPSLEGKQNSKATKLHQSAIEAIASGINIRDKRFASASDLKSELFDQPLTAVIWTATCAHQHTLLHPEGIKTHFSFHHVAPAMIWTAEYKTQMEGAIKSANKSKLKEQVPEQTPKQQSCTILEKWEASATSTSIGNFYCLMNTIIGCRESAHRLDRNC